jgi:hypothetical protein
MLLRWIIMRILIIGLVVLMFYAMGGVEMSLAMKVLHVEDKSGDNLVKNNGFETLDNGNANFWSPYNNGYKAISGIGRNNSIGILCKNEKGQVGYGIQQNLALNQKTPMPIAVKGWSKAENVGGGKDSNYSIYVDIMYQDNSTLWGQTGNFSTGTHDWEKKEFVIIPTKPIKSLMIYGLFRSHIGTAIFDDFELYEMGKGASMLDNLPIELPEPKRVDAVFNIGFDTKGLSVGYDWQTGIITSLKIGNDELSQTMMPSGFFVRDVASNSDFYQVQNGVCEELGLSIDARAYDKDGCLYVEGQIRDNTSNDRAVTLIFALPIDAVGWKWHNDIRSARTIESGTEYSNCVSINTGSSGMMSLYPLGVISNDKYGLALAVDMDMPAQYRIAYNSITKQFFIAYDFGLAKETDNFPSSAPFKFVVYKTDSKWGFRSGAKRLYETFPDLFACRSKDQGIWMPFTDISTVQGWEDFGFKYHEGNNNVPFDDQANILSFRYTEPSTWWMRMDPKIERTDENITKSLNEYAKLDNQNARRKAESAVISGSFDEQGRYQYLVRNEPWCDGAVFSTNPNPYIPGNSEAKLDWNEDVKQRLYGPQAKGVQDGEYLDSLEAYVTADENFRRDHFHYVTIPLTFSSSSKKPVIHKAMSVYEFSKWLADDVHKMGKLMFANSVPYRFSFLCPFFDVMGSEINWIGGDGKWQPGSDSWMNLCRTMSYQKPYLFLMNTRYEKFTTDLVEKYFQRSLFYGMFPSMFSHNASQDPYWQNPNLYNRDRHLFKKYIPMIKKIAEAGWEPITYAMTDNDKVYIERFGSVGVIYFTLLNDSNSAQEVGVTIMSKDLGLEKQELSTDMISGEELKATIEGDNIVLKLKMSPEQVMLLVFKKL